MRVGARGEQCRRQPRQCAGNWIDWRLETSVAVLSGFFQGCCIDFEFPNASELLLELNVNLARLCVVARPVKGQCCAARQMGIAAVLISRQAIAKRNGVFPVIAAAYG